MTLHVISQALSSLSMYENIHILFSYIYKKVYKTNHTRNLQSHS